MAITVDETPESREWNNGQLTFRYIVQGTSDAVAAMDALLDEAPDSFDGLVRAADATLTAQWVDEDGGTGLWNGNVNYVPPQSRKAEPSVGTQVIQGSTTGGTQHVTQAIQTIAKHAPPGKTAPEFHGAINVTQDSVDGVDIAVPVFNFTVTKTYPAPAEWDTPPSVQTMFALTATVNTAAFTVTDTVTGITLAFAAGECLFLGASFGAARTDGGLEITFNFSASPNKANILVGDVGWEKLITVTAKAGWEYLWVRYQDAGDDTAKKMVKIPVGAYVEKVYNAGDFSLLGLV